jgi:hypothetical protein
MLWFMIAWDAKGPFATKGQLSGGSVFYFNRRGLLEEATSIVVELGNLEDMGRRAVAVFRTRGERDEVLR